MNLGTQIVSLIVSFSFGILFSVCTDLNYRFLFSKKQIIKIIITIVYIIDFTLLYFLILKYLNNGVLHYYFIIFIVMGYTFSFKFINRMFDKIKLKIKSKISVKFRKEQK